MLPSGIIFVYSILSQILFIHISFILFIYKYGQTFSLTSKIQSNEIIRNKIENVYFFSFSTTTKQLFTSSLTRESRTLMREKKKQHFFFAVRLFFVVL